MYRRYYKAQQKFITFLFLGRDIKSPFNVQIPVDTEFIGTCTHNLLFRAKHIFGHLYTATTLNI